MFTPCKRKYGLGNLTIVKDSSIHNHYRIFLKSFVVRFSGKVVDYLEKLKRKIFLESSLQLQDLKVCRKVWFYQDLYNTKFFWLIPSSKKRGLRELLKPQNFIIESSKWLKYSLLSFYSHNFCEYIWALETFIMSYLMIFFN